MGIKIITDGPSIEKTQIIDTETGNQIPNVTRLEIVIDAQTRERTLVLHFRDFEVTGMFEEIRAS